MNNKNAQVDRRAAHTHYTNLDVAKFVCALLVVIIHTDPLSALSEIAGFYLKDVFARTAVPLFFAISGFLFFGGLDFHDDRIRNSSENRKRLAKYVKRVAGLYLIWSLVYILLSLPGWYRAGWWGINVVRDCIISVLLKGGHYHLWYLLALVYAVPVLYAIMCLISRRTLSTVIGCFWLCECLVYSYSWTGIDRIAVVQFISQRVPIAFDALFRAVPLLAVGAVCAVPSASGKAKEWGVKLAASAGLCAAEASLLYFMISNADRYSYLLATPLMAYCAMRFLTYSRQIRISGKNAKLLRNMSLSIYCIHPFVITIMMACHVPEGLFMWLAVTLISIVISYLRERIRRDAKAG